MFQYYAYAVINQSSPEKPLLFAKFRGMPQDALAFFFSKGFQFPYDADVFVDKSMDHIYEEFEADGEDIPNRINIATGVPDERTMDLVGIKRVRVSTGGRKTLRKTKARKTRKHRK